MTSSSESSAARSASIPSKSSVFASNHYHLLLRVEDARQLSRFMGYFNGNLAREVTRLTGWEDKVWSTKAQVCRQA